MWCAICEDCEVPDVSAESLVYGGWVEDECGAWICPGCADEWQLK